MLIVREARAKGSFVKGIRQGTAPKEYMLEGGRNWVWGELHIPTSGMPGADRMADVAQTMADVAQTVCETIAVHLCGRHLCGRCPTGDVRRSRCRAQTMGVLIESRRLGALRLRANEKRVRVSMTHRR